MNNNNYYGPNTMYKANANVTPPNYTNGTITPPGNISIMDTSLPMEQSYIENILRLNKGKKVRVHMTFPDSIEFRDREFIGIIEESGRDHIILSEPDTGRWQLLLMIYVDFISFDERINYSPEFTPNS